MQQATNLNKSMITFISLILALITTDALTMATNELRFTSIERPTDLLPTSADTQSCRTRDELTSLWEKYHGDANLMPAIDFNSNMVLFASRGEKNSGGFGIEIESVTEKETEIVVKCVNVDPPPGAMVTMALTYPYAMATVPKSSKPVRYVIMDAAPPPRQFPKFLLTFDDGADLRKISQEIEEKDVVKDVDLMEGVRIAVVTFDSTKVTEGEAMALLQSISGVATAEMDPPPPMDGEAEIGMGGMGF